MFGREQPVLHQTKQGSQHSAHRHPLLPNATNKSNKKFLLTQMSNKMLMLAQMSNKKLMLAQMSNKQLMLAQMSNKKLMLAQVSNKKLLLAQMSNKKLPHLMYLVGRIEILSNKRNQESRMNITVVPSNQKTLHFLSNLNLQQSNRRIVPSSRKLLTLHSKERCIPQTSLRLWSQAWSPLLVPPTGRKWLRTSAS